MQRTLSLYKEKMSLSLSPNSVTLVKPHHMISQALVMGSMIAFLFFWLSVCVCLSGCSPVPSDPPTLQTPPRGVIPSPRLTPVAVGPDFYNSAWHYLDLVLNQQYLQAYHMLSPAQQAHEPYTDFVVKARFK